MLGKRWVYDAAGDPVFVATVLAFRRGIIGEVANLLKVKL